MLLRGSRRRGPLPESRSGGRTLSACRKSEKGKEGKGKKGKKGKTEKKERKGTQRKQGRRSEGRGGGEECAPIQSAPPR